MEEKELVQKFLKTRSENSFLLLYRSQSAYLFKMAHWLTQDTYLSQELIQEMWLVAIRKLPDFEWKSELKTWLTAILINLHRSKRKTFEKDITSKALPLSDIDQSTKAWDSSSSDLEKVMRQLPAGYRQILLLHDIEGYKHREIAEILDISEGTSKSQLFHARKALKELINIENF